MSINKTILIPTDQVSLDFKDHLEQPGNKRILFSAPFGTGKSYFLNSFFKTDKNSLTITLHPVEYSIASNEDIFELIKHDIIVALMENYLMEIGLEKEDFSRLLLAQEFVRSEMKFTGLAKILLSPFLSLPKEAEELTKETQSTLKAFKEFEAEMKIDEEQIIVEYVAKKKCSKGPSEKQMRSP